MQHSLLIKFNNQFILFKSVVYTELILILLWCAVTTTLTDRHEENQSRNLNKHLLYEYIQNFFAFFIICIFVWNQFHSLIQAVRKSYSLELKYIPKMWNCLISILFVAVFINCIFILINNNAVLASLQIILEKQYSKYCINFRKEKVMHNKRL